MEALKAIETTPSNTKLKTIQGISRVTIYRSEIRAWGALNVLWHSGPARILSLYTPDRSQGCTAARLAISRIVILIISSFLTAEMDLAGIFPGGARSWNIFFIFYRCMSTPKKNSGGPKVSAGSPSRASTAQESVIYMSSDMSLRHRNPKNGLFQLIFLVGKLNLL